VRFRGSCSSVATSRAECRNLLRQPLDFILQAGHGAYTTPTSSPATKCPIGQRFWKRQSPDWPARGRPAFKNDLGDLRMALESGLH
jgi:hypothetical protein